jgi:hypothetical protein
MFLLLLFPSYPSIHRSTVTTLSSSASRAIGVDLEVCLVVRNYVFIRALSVPMDIVNESYRKYLMSIGMYSRSPADVIDAP